LKIHALEKEAGFWPQAVHRLNQARPGRLLLADSMKPLPGNSTAVNFSRPFPQQYNTGQDNLTIKLRGRQISGAVFAQAKSVTRFAGPPAAYC